MEKNESSRTKNQVFELADWKWSGASIRFHHSGFLLEILFRFVSFSFSFSLSLSLFGDSYLNSSGNI